MGRLFWKILLALWAALLCGSLLVGGIAWIYRPTSHHMIAGGPGARLMLSTAATTLRQHGLGALKTFAAEVALEDKFVYLQAIDAQGRDALGHMTDPAAVAEAREMAAQPAGHRLATTAHSPDGNDYLLFLTHANGPGPHLGPPPDWTHPPGPESGHMQGFGPGPGPGTFQFVIISVGILGSLAFSALLAWYLAKPIRHLRQGLQGLAQGHMETRVQPLIGRRRDELADLGRDFDRMSQQLQTLMQAQQRLLQDVSHELRSPLARLQAAISLGRQSPDRIAQTFERAELEIHRLDQLVGELLTLARLENNALHELPQLVELHELIAAIAEDAGFESLAENKTLHFDNSADILLMGNAELLHRAFENVIRNAVRHTATGTCVEIQALTEADQVRVTVNDHGPGVKPSELDQIFEPFYRGEQNGLSKGFGFGLSIARRAILAHGGTITARNQSSGGLSIEIMVPLAPPKSAPSA